MDKTTITFSLPSELIRDAQKAGILDDKTIEELLSKELERKRKADEFFEIIGALQKIAPPITPEEIDAEIAAYRAELDAQEAQKSE